MFEGRLVTSDLWKESEPHRASGLSCVHLSRYLVESGSDFVHEFAWIASDCDQSATFVCEISMNVFFLKHLSVYKFGLLQKFLIFF